MGSYSPAMCGLLRCLQKKAAVASLRRSLGPLAASVLSSMAKSGHDETFGQPAQQQGAPPPQKPNPESQPGNWKSRGGSMSGSGQRPLQPMPSAWSSSSSPGLSVSSPEPAMMESKVAAWIRYWAAPR